VKFVKRNAMAGRSFEAFSSLEIHLAEWMRAADERIHGTTHQKPRERFERDEKSALRALPARPPPRRQQLLRRRVANDALVDVDTVRYSVPHALIREHVEVQLGDEQVSIFHGSKRVATHRRSNEPYARIVDPAHWKGLWRETPATPPETSAEMSPLHALGRSLNDYAEVIERGAA
jgi:hypothetical protein